MSTFSLADRLRLNVKNWNSKEKSKAEAFSEVIKTDIDKNIDILSEASQSGKSNVVIEKYTGLEKCSMLESSLKYLEGYRGLNFFARFTSDYYSGNETSASCDLVADWKK